MTLLTLGEIPASDKLRVLQRLHEFRNWESLDDKRQCIQCGEIITGREIKVMGGMRGRGPLRLECPTSNCPAIPIDWILLNDSSQFGKNVKAPGRLPELVASSATVVPARRRSRFLRGLGFRLGVDKAQATNSN